MIDMYISRAKRTSNGKWIYGYYVGNAFDQAYICQKRYPTASWSVIPVDALTLGRFTGIRDKRGNCIYDGDIVECWSQGVCARGTVQQRKDGLWIIYPSCQNQVMWGLCPDDNGNSIVEIVGNIYEKEEMQHEDT